MMKTANKVATDSIAVNAAAHPGRLRRHRLLRDSADGYYADCEVREPAIGRLNWKLHLVARLTQGAVLSILPPDA